MHRGAGGVIEARILNRPCEQRQSEGSGAGNQGQSGDFGRAACREKAQRVRDVVQGRETGRRTHQDERAPVQRAGPRYVIRARITQPKET